MDINKYRRELKDFIKQDVKKSYKSFQNEAKSLLSLSDDELENWISVNKADSFLAYALNKGVKKDDEAKYKRLKNKSEQYDFEGFSENEEEFIAIFEEENNIENSILDIPPQ